MNERRELLETASVCVGKDPITAVGTNLGTVWNSLNCLQPNGTK